MFAQQPPPNPEGTDAPLPQFRVTRDLALVILRYRLCVVPSYVQKLYLASEFWPLSACFTSH